MKGNTAPTHPAASFRSYRPPPAQQSSVEKVLRVFKVSKSPDAWFTGLQTVASSRTVLIGQCVAGHKHRKFASVQPRIVYRRLCWSPLKAGTGAPGDIQPLAWAKYASERHNYFRYSITVCVDTVMQRMCY